VDAAVVRGGGPGPGAGMRADSVPASVVRGPLIPLQQAPGATAAAALKYSDSLLHLQQRNHGSSLVAPSTPVASPCVEALQASILSPALSAASSVVAPAASSTAFQRVPSTNNLGDVRRTMATHAATTPGLVTPSRRFEREVPLLQNDQLSAEVVGRSMRYGSMTAPTAPSMFCGSRTGSARGSPEPRSAQACSNTGTQPPKAGPAALKAQAESNAALIAAKAMVSSGAGPQGDRGHGGSRGRHGARSPVSEERQQLVSATLASFRDKAVPSRTQRRISSCCTPVLATSASPRSSKGSIDNGWQYGRAGGTQLTSPQNAIAGGAQACQPSRMANCSASGSCTPTSRSAVMPTAAVAETSPGNGPGVLIEKGPRAGGAQSPVPAEGGQMIWIGSIAALPQPVTRPLSARASPVKAEALRSASPGPMTVHSAATPTVGRLKPTLGSPRSTAPTGIVTAPVPVRTPATKGSVGVSVAPNIDGCTELQWAADRISVDKEFARLREDLANERAARHALAMRVEALSRSCEDDRGVPGLPASQGEGNTTASASFATEQEETTRHQQRRASSASRSPSFSAHYGNGVFRSAVAISEADRLNSTSENSGYSSPGIEATVDEETDLLDGSVLLAARVVCADDVLENELADARAILAELEHDLAIPNANMDASISLPLGATEDDSAGDEAAAIGVATSGISSVRVRASTEAEEAFDGGAPHVLSFYRRKCIELASQVHSRDAEVKMLRRALSEARFASDLPPGVPCSRDVEGELSDNDV